MRGKRRGGRMGGNLSVLHIREAWEDRRTAMNEKVRAVAAWTRGRHGNPRGVQIDPMDVWVVVSFVVGVAVAIAHLWG